MANRQSTNLAIVPAIIQRVDMLWVIENLNRKREVDLPSLQVFLPFPLVPFELHAGP